MKFERLLQQQRQGGPLDLRRQFIVRFAAKHPAKAGDLQRRFVALLLLDLNASLDNGPQPRQHRLLLPGVTGHERFQLLRHQVHTFDVVPQTIFQQDKVNRRDAVAAAEEGAGLQQANMPKAIMDIAKRFQNDAQVIKVVRKELTVENIEQYYYEVRPKNKCEVLCRLIDIYNPRLSVVFCNTKRQVDELISDLKGRGYFADGIHGDMKQAQRDRVMADFRNGKTEILIATDVAARGIDVDDVDIVFNYDLPQDEEYYVHRIGRTGRAGREGLALTFISGKEVYKLKDIEHYCKTKIKAKPIPSLDDVKNTKLEVLFEKIKETIAEGGISDMIEMVENHVNDEDYTSMDMAAALLKMVIGDSLDRDDDVEEVHFDMYEDDNRMVRLFINVGKKDKIKPANILGAIAGESGMPGKLVGAIDMLDNYTFVEVPAKHADKVLKAMSNAKIKGRSINIEKAQGGRKKKGRRK